MRLRCLRSSLTVNLLIISILVLFSSCAERPFSPVNVGREYGNPKTPFVVSHLPERNQWSLNRVHQHNIFQRTLCFNYVCRKMIGRSKTLLTISNKEYIEVMKRNAKRGFFGPTTPITSPPKKFKPDSIPSLVDSVTITSNKIIPTPEAPTLKMDSLVTLSEFLFEINSFKLRAEHFSELDVLSDYLQAHPILEVIITGYTDNTRDKRNNVTLSTRRAEAVAEYLVSKGVNYDMVIFKGLGSAQPIMSNETEEGRSKNRRVEILIHNPKR